MSCFSKNRGKTIKVKHTEELRESRNTEMQKELLKEDIGSNFQLNLFQQTTFLWSTLCTLCSQSCWAVGVHFHQPCPPCFTCEYLAQPPQTDHPVSIFPQHRHALWESQRGRQDLAKCPRGRAVLGTTLTCLRNFPKQRLEGMPALLQWSDSMLCRNHLAVIVRNQKGQKAHWTVYRRHSI